MLNFRAYWLGLDVKCEFSLCENAPDCSKENEEYNNCFDDCLDNCEYEEYNICYNDCLDNCDNLYQVLGDCQKNDGCEEGEKPWDQCRVLTKEGIAFNVNQCLVKLYTKDLVHGSLVVHDRATCWNNCKGVNPNAITAAGVALTALSGIGSTAGLGPGAVGLLGAVGAGEAKMN